MVPRVQPFLLLVTVAIATVAAQQMPPVFRGGTFIVPLDATVLDKDGKPVIDLKPSDFTVFENDVQQDIRAFFPQAFTPQPVPPDDPATLNRAAKSDRLLPQTRRTFLLVLGYGRIQYPGRAVDGALAFVREHLLPQDRVAVLAFNRATDVTTDHAQVAQVLDRFKRDHERIIGEIGVFKAGHRGMPIPPELQAEIDAVFTGQTRAESLASLKGPLATHDRHMRSATEMLLGADVAPGQVPRGATLVPRWSSNADDGVMVSDLMKVYAGIGYLRYLEGEKHLVLLGPRIWFRKKEDDQALAVRANDARVVLDMIHTAGVERPPRAGQPIVASLGTNAVLQIASSMNISEYTGGYYTGVVTADNALARLDESTRFSYLLGYAPTNPALDGTLRQVRVKVNRPGVTVQFHHQYYALENLPPLDLKDLIVTSRMAGAAAAETPATDIRLRVKASEMPRLGTLVQLRVDVTIDASRLAFTPGPAGKTAALEVEVLCGNDREPLVGDLKQHLDVTADDETYARFLKDGVPFSARVPLTGPARFIKVIVYDSAADLLGTFVLKLNPPNPG